MVSFLSSHFKSKKILTKLFSKKNIQKILPFLVLLSLAILGYWQIAMFRHPLKWDIIDQAFPWKHFIGECLQNNMLPLWNPYQHCGYPIHADPQSSAWYPITWFFGYFWGYSIYILSIDFTFHIFLAGSGMYLLGKRLGFKKKVALIMGTAYMFSGFFVGNGQHFMWIISATWLPFILYAYIDLYRKRKTKQAVIFGLLIFLMVTGGYPIFTMILLYLLLFLFILFSVSIYKKEGRLPLFYFIKINILALVFSIANSVVMLFSVWKLMPELTRTGGVSLSQALLGPLSPQSLISFVFPYGAVSHDWSYFGTDLSMTNVYFGLIPLVFFVASLFMKKNPLFKFFLIWGLFILSASVGNALPVREFLYNYIPYFDIFRFPSMLRIFAIISFIVLGGFAINEYVTNEGKYKKLLQISILSTALLLVVLMAVSSYGKTIELIEFLGGGNLFTMSKKSTIAQQLFFQGIVQLVFLGIFFLLTQMIKSHKKQLSILVVLVLVDMIFAVQLNAPYTVYSKNFSQKAIYEEVEKLPKGFPLPGMQAVITNNDITARHFASSWRNLNIFHKQIAYDGYNPTQLRNFNFLDDSLKPAFKATLNNPPVYFGTHFFSNEIIAKKTRTDVDSSMVFVAADDLQTMSPGIPQSEDKISLTGFSPNKIQFETKSKGERFAVILQNNYYGWEAKIDGNDTKTINTNICFMGVAVPEGRHQITISFKPRLIIAGFYFSLISVIVSLLILLKYYFWPTNNLKE